jgi:hypothetical protein
VDIVWKGKLSLDKIQWTKSDIKFQLPNKFEMDRKNIWKTHIKHYPDSYNGQLIFTSNIILGYDNINFLCGTIDYKDLLTLRENNHRFGSPQGNLAFKLIIKEKKEENYLVGKRSKKLYYLAGNYTSIGGMFERDDLKGNIFRAIEREVSEECSEIKITPEIELTSIIREAHGLGLTMIFQTSINKLYTEMQLDANDEWEKNKLQWLSLAKIRELGNDILVEDLQILIS